MLLEALVLFARVPSWRRAAWLGFVFLMTGLTCINWFLLALVPCILSVLLLVVRHRLQRARAFWLRGSLALIAATLLLLPFVWPYYMASKLYGFRRDAEEVTRNSAGLVDWLTAPGYNKVWQGMGAGLPNVKATLFPGLLALLLALAALLLVNNTTRNTQSSIQASNDDPNKRWLYTLDALCVIAGCVAYAAAGFAGAPALTWGGALAHVVTADRALLGLTVALTTRLAMAYPRFIRRRADCPNLIASLRSERRSDAFWLGVIWAGFGFLCSFGMSTFFYRVFYDFVLPFQSIRAPYRAGMICFVGLALLAGLGAEQLAQRTVRWRPALKPWVVYAVIACALLFELHAAPLPFVRGAVFPDAVTLRLRATPMRGGVVELPSAPEPPFYSWHMSMLRAADHGRPVVSAASSFIPPLTIKVHDLTKGPGIHAEFLDLLEEIPASYVVVRRGLIAPERQAEFAAFCNDAVASGRLRLLATYAPSDDLYVVTKTEPDAH